MIPNLSNTFINLAVKGIWCKKKTDVKSQFEKMSHDWVMPTLISYVANLLEGIKDVWHFIFSGNLTPTKRKWITSQIYIRVAYRL